MQAAQTEAYNHLKGLSKAELLPVMRQVVEESTPDDQKEIAQTVTAAANGGFPPPNGKTRDRLWTIVVSAFAFVLVGGFIALAIGMFYFGGETVKPELLLTTFTTVVGFLAGLFTPSPVANAPANDGGN